MYECWLSGWGEGSAEEYSEEYRSNTLTWVILYSPKENSLKNVDVNFYKVDIFCILYKIYQKNNSITCTTFFSEAFGTTWTKHYCTYDKNTRVFGMLPYNQLTTKSVSSLKHKQLYSLNKEVV